MTTAPARSDDPSAVRRRTGRSKGDQREAQILEAARALLRERPLASVTIDDLASAAGISRTGFYFYFPTKQAVLAALIEQAWSDFGATHAWFDTAGPSPDELREQTTAVLAVWRDHGQVLACTLASGESYAPLEQFGDRARSRFVDGLAAKITRDRAAGLAPEGIDARTLAGLVLDLRDGRMAHMTSDPDTDGELVVSDVVEAVLRLVYGRWA
ncbi:TetR/AcrR family transcriptional regulator [Jatrophihabitans fulvus]